MTVSRRRCVVVTACKTDNGMWKAMQMCQRALLQVPDVTEAEVHLNPQGAIITMIKDINVEDLQTQLDKSGHYTIKEVLNN